MLGPAFLISAPLVIGILGFFTYYLKWAPSDSILVGLLHYTCNDPSTRTVKPAADEPVSKKQAKKLEQQEKKMADYGGEQLMIVPLTQAFVARLEYIAEFDNLLLFALMLIFHSVVSLVVVHVVKIPDNKIWVAFAALNVGWALYTLMQTTAMYSTVGKRDKVYMLLFGSLAFLASAYALTSGFGRRMLAFDITAASHEAATRMQLVVAELQRKAQQPGAGEEELAAPLAMPAVFHTAITLVMVVAAATFSSLMMLPAMKSARLVWQAATPHWWAQRNCSSFSWWQVLAMRLAFAMPGLTATLWVVPLTEVLGLTPARLLYLQPAAVLATSGVMVLALRPLVQSHLDSGCLEWYRLKHGAVGDDYKGRLHGISNNVRYIFQLTGRVALQLAAPPVLLLVLGLALLTRSLPVPWAQLELDQSPSRLWQVLMGFPAWWLCCCWFSYGSMMMFFQRFGLVSSNRVYFE